MPLLGILALAAAPAFAGPRIIFLDVGTGDCILIECSASESILIDCGSTKHHENVDSDQIVEFLKKRNIVTAVVTHGDNDHYGIFKKLLEKLMIPSQASLNKMKKIMVGGIEKDYKNKHSKNDPSTIGEAFWQTLKQFNKKTGPPKVLDPSNPPSEGAWLLPLDFNEAGANRIVSCSSPTKFSFTVLAANRGGNSSSNAAHDVNARSIVLKLEYERNSPPATTSGVPTVLPSGTGSGPIRVGPARREANRRKLDPYPTRPQPPGRSIDPVTSPAKLTVYAYFMGDAERETESKILRSGIQEEKEKPPKTQACRTDKGITAMDVDSDGANIALYSLLKIGHHGSFAGSSKAWLEHVKQGAGQHAAVISAGGKFGHPRCAVLLRMAPAGTQVCQGDPQDGVKEQVACFVNDKSNEPHYVPGMRGVHSTHIRKQKGRTITFDLQTLEIQYFDSPDEIPFPFP